MTGNKKKLNITKSNKRTKETKIDNNDQRPTDNGITSNK